MSEVLTWDSEALEGAITAEDLAPLRNFATRGDNLTMPGAAGVRPYAPVRDQLDVSIVWVVTGRFDHTGAPNSDSELGAEVNQEHYRTLFTTGGDAVTGEHEITLTFAGTTFDGLAQCREYAAVRTGPTTFQIVTRLVIADGELTVTSS